MNIKLLAVMDLIDFNSIKFLKEYIFLYLSFIEEHQKTGK